MRMRGAIAASCGRQADAPHHHSMRTDTPQPIRLSDYRPPAFLIDEVQLDFDLQPTATRVKARLTRPPQRRPRRAAGAQRRAAEADLGRHRRPRRWPRPSVRDRRRVPDHPGRARRLHPGDRGRDRPGRTTRRWRASTCPAAGSAPSARPRASARSPGSPDRPDVLSRFTVRIEADKALPPPAVQRQPDRERRAAGRPPLRRLERPLPQALLPVRPGGRRAGRAGGQLHHHERPHRRPADLRRSRHGARAPPTPWTR